MSLPERFWWILTVSAIVWYLSVAVYVAIRGAFDIRGMLTKLQSDKEREQVAAELDNKST